MTKKSSLASGEVVAPADPFVQAVESFEDDQQQAAAARIPPEHGGIQINFCKNPTCDNFGQPEVGGVAKWAKNSQARYKVSSAGKGYPHLTCLRCGSLFPMKSNLDIDEELERIDAHGMASL